MVDAPWRSRAIHSAVTQAVFGGQPQTGTVLRYLNGKRAPPLEARISYAGSAGVGA